jgi:hypothetical protein
VSWTSRTEGAASMPPMPQCWDPSAERLKGDLYRPLRAVFQPATGSTGLRPQVRFGHHSAQAIQRDDIGQGDLAVQLRSGAFGEVVLRRHDQVRPAAAHATVGRT